jgi:hypothetical protein
MTHHETDRDGRRERFLVNGLWVTSAAIVVAGFILRSLSTLFERRDLRYSGVVLIGLGVVLAALSWLGERFVKRTN